MGSDAGCMCCVVEKDGEYYVLNGSKNFIIYGKLGYVVVVIVCIGEFFDSYGMIVFVVECGMLGFIVGKKENKLGMCVSEIVEMIFDNC